MGRKPRNSETRESTTRTAESRSAMRTTHQSRFYIPPEVIPKTMTYAWVAITFDNAGTQNKTTGTRSTALAGPRFLVTVIPSCFRRCRTLALALTTTLTLMKAVLFFAKSPLLT